MGKDGKDWKDKKWEIWKKWKKWKNKLEINVIMVRKLNYLKNDAGLDGQWWNLMDKDRF